MRQSRYTTEIIKFINLPNSKYSNKRNIEQLDNLLEYLKIDLNGDIDNLHKNLILILSHSNINYINEKINEIIRSINMDSNQIEDYEYHDGELEL